MVRMLRVPLLCRDQTSSPASLVLPQALWPKLPAGSSEASDGITVAVAVGIAVVVSIWSLMFI